MNNLLQEKVEYKTDTTPRGVWRRFLYPGGAYFAEFKSHRTFWGLPLLHFTRGICPETGRRVVARGVVAVGRLATGILAIGQAAWGVIGVGQLGVGLLGVGQLALGLVALGQLAGGVFFGLGQLAAGFVAVGQLAAGNYVLALKGYGAHIWSPQHADPEAVAFFKSLLENLWKSWRP